MRVKALYNQTDPNNDGSVVHGIDHDGGGFVVSSEIVGIAVQNFLNNATSTDMMTLHTHLLYAFKDAWIEETAPINVATLADELLVSEQKIRDHLRNNYSKKLKHTKYEDWAITPEAADEIRAYFA